MDQSSLDDILRPQAVLYGRQQHFKGGSILWVCPELGWPSGHPAGRCGRLPACWRPSDTRNPRRSGNIDRMSVALTHMHRHTLAGTGVLGVTTHGVFPFAGGNDAMTIATMPARKAAGKSDHAATTAASPGSGSLGGVHAVEPAVFFASFAARPCVRSRDSEMCVICLASRDSPNPSSPTAKNPAPAAGFFVVVPSQNERYRSSFGQFSRSRPSAARSTPVAAGSPRARKVLCKVHGEEAARRLSRLTTTTTHPRPTATPHHLLTSVRTAFTPYPPAR
jgi:hypothetical protein